MSHVYPIGSRLNEAGRLEVGGCDVLELAREFGTPAYVYAEDDIRARARAYMDAFRARTERFEVVYASKAFPCTAAFRLLVEEGLSADVASGGEFHLALQGGFAPERCYMHGNNKTEAELVFAAGARDRAHRGGLVRRDRPPGTPRTRSEGDAARDARDQARHAREDPDRAGGLEVRLRARRRAARDRARSRRWSCAGCTPTSARRCSTSSRSSGWRRCSPGWATIRCSTWAAAWLSPTRPTRSRHLWRATWTPCWGARRRA